MAVNLNPYINFRDDARQAMEFYASVFGGELNVMTFGDIGAADDPSESDLVMHSQLEAPGGLVLMGADTPARMTFEEGARVSVSLSGGPEDHDTLSGWYDKLAEGGTVVQPLAQAPWGDTFGMTIDRFGIQWLVNIAGQSSS